MGVLIKSKSILDLSKTPFKAHAEGLTDPESYSASQALGASMRKAGDIDAFFFISARCKEKGLNAALFNINSFAKPQPIKQIRLICEIKANQVSVKGYDGVQVFSKI